MSHSRGRAITSRASPINRSDFRHNEPFSAPNDARACTLAPVADRTMIDLHDRNRSRSGDEALRRADRNREMNAARKSRRG